MSEQFKLVAIKNPFDRRMRDEKTFIYDGNMSVGELIEQNLPAHVEMAVSINGQVITEAEWSTRKIRCGEQVVVVPVVHGGGGGIGSLLSIALMFVAPEIAFMATGFESYAAAYYSFSGLMGVAAYGAVSMGVSLIGSALISTLTAPDSPTMPGSAGSSQSFDTSPTYSWSPVTTQEPGGAVSRVYGTHKVYGNIVGGYIKNSGDNGKDQTAYMLVDLGIGPIKSLSDYKINDQEIAAYSGVEVIARYGNLNQTVIPTFDDTYLVRSVGQKVTKYDVDVPTSGPKTITTSGNNFNALEVTLVFPSGLYYSNDSGGLSTQSVEVQVDISDDDGATWVSMSKRPQNEVIVHGGGFWSLGYMSPVWNGEWGQTGGEYVEVSRGSNIQSDHSEGELSGPHTWSWRPDGSSVWIDEADTTVISGATTKAIRRTFRADHLTNGIPYKIRVTNLTTDITTSRYGDDMIFAEYSEVLYDDFQYPRSVLVAVKALATDQLSGGMKFSCLEEGAYIRVWNGSAWSSVFSNNTAWVVWDILTQPVLDNDLNVVRYDGFNPSRLDLTSFYAWAQWCDDLVPNGSGGTERRCEFDGVFDTSSSMWDSAMDVCRTARANLFFKGTTVCVVYDHARTTPAQLFTVGNTKGGFKETFLPIQDRAAALEVQYVDKDQDYTRDKITVVNTNITESSSNRTGVSLRGVVRTTQAWRESTYRLARNEYLLKSGEIHVDIDSLACTVGDLVWIQDDVTQWGVGGRCGTGSTLNTITLDQPVTLESGKSYEVSVRLADDTIMTRTVISAPGTMQTINVTPLMTEAPELYAPWALGEVGKSIKEFLLVDVARTGDQDATLKLAEYNSSIYNGDLGEPIIPTKSISYNPTPSITDLVIEEIMYVAGDGSIQIDVVAHFTPTNVVKTFGCLDGVGVTDTTYDSVRFSNLTSGQTYNITLKPRGLLGDAGSASWIGANYTVLGKAANPATVSSLSIVGDTLLWPKVADIDLAGYLIRFQYGSNLEWGTANPMHAGLVTDSPYVMQITPPGQVTIMVRAIDTSGNESVASAYVITQFGDSIVSNVMETKDFRAAAWAGTYTNATLSGGDLISTQTDPFYKSDASNFYGLDSSPFYSANYDPIEWISAEWTPSLAAVGSNMTLAWALTGDATNIQYRKTGPSPFYGIDSEAFYGLDADPFYAVADPWAPWAGSVPAENITYQWRVTTTTGPTEGNLSAFTVTVDVPDRALTLNGVAIGSGGTRLAGAIGQFNILQNIQLTLQGGSTAVMLEASDYNNALGPLVAAKNAAGAGVAATIDALLQGY